MTESRIESICTNSHRVLPGILELNRALRDLALCQLEGKDYFVEKAKKWEAKRKTNGAEITRKELEMWMKQQ